MCQLFSISASAPVRLDLNWDRFTARGSAESGNPDGWGVALCDHNDVSLIREPSPAADSRTVQFLEQHAPAAPTIISHVRRATRGVVSLPNTQPFVRRAWGRSHIFAHNGFVPGFQADSLRHYHEPVGDTDSEAFFGHLLARLEPLWQRGDPSVDHRRQVVEAISADARSQGAANFIYFDGDVLFVHAHRRTVPGDAISTDPGLYALERRLSSGDDMGAPCAGAVGNPNCERQVVIATEPLDGQPWRPLASGELWCLRGGRLVA